MSELGSEDQVDIVLNAMSLGHLYASTAKGLPADSKRMFDWAGLLLAVKYYTAKRFAVCAVLSEKYLKKLTVEEKIGEQNFRVFSEKRFLANIRVTIFDFCRVCRNFNII